ncbi:MAG: TOBE domain-containing protein, partial [Actinomycetota bacterium]|nr:TOBE domain-containing protein [Actinomycetota bacterium]
SLNGVIDTITYLGNARVYGVKLDWMSIEIRQENRPDADLYEHGDEITVYWNTDDVSVVAG